MIKTRFLSATVAATILAMACSKSDKKETTRKTSSADSQSMSAMPGMSNAKGAAPDTSSMQTQSGASGETAGALATSLTFTPAQIQHGGIKWSAVTMSNAAGSAIVPGEVSPNEDRTARLGAPAPGRVLSVSVRPGDRVGRGQTLVTMQSPEAGMAQSDVSKAQAELASRRAEAQYATTARGRAERLLALKAIPRQDYDRAIADDERARSSLTEAEAELARARATANQLSVGMTANGLIVLRAPLSGVVLERSAVPGTVVEAGAPLVVVSDPSTLWLTVNAPEQLAGLFQRGGRLRFTVPAFPDTFNARVDAVGAGLEPTTRTLSVRALVTGGLDRLKAHMIANVLVEGVGTIPAVFVPEDAVQLIQGKPNVFLVHPDGKGGARFDRREVTLGSRGGGRVAVLRGITTGDVIVSAGAFAVKAQFQKSTMPKMEM